MHSCEREMEGGECNLLLSGLGKQAVASFGSGVDAVKGNNYSTWSCNFPPRDCVSFLCGSGRGGGRGRELGPVGMKHIY